MLTSAAEVGFACDGEDKGWVRVSPPLLRLMSGPIQHFHASILDALRYIVLPFYPRGMVFWEVGLKILKILCNYSPLTTCGERDKMLLRAILCGCAWNGFLHGKTKKEDVLVCRSCGKSDGDGHLFWERTFLPKLHVWELPEFASLLALDRCYLSR